MLLLCDLLPLLLQCGVSMIKRLKLIIICTEIHWKQGWQWAIFGLVWGQANLSGVHTGPVLTHSLIGPKICML